MRASPPERSRPRWAHPGILAAAAGVSAFLFTAVFEPPVFAVALLLSLPFFYYVAESRWKDAAIWIIATVPYQYYFDVGGLNLTHTELYLFAFAFAYLLSRGAAERAVLVPSALLLPGLYGVSQITPVVSGHADLVKNAVRVLAAVFFCPRPGACASPRPNSWNAWARSAPTRSSRPSSYWVNASRSTPIPAAT